VGWGGGVGGGGGGGGSWGAGECLSNKEESLCIVGMCGTCEGQEKCVWSFGWEKLKEESCLHDVGVDGRVTFECILTFSVRHLNAIKSTVGRRFLGI
jgi:hypothetical protein